MCERVSPLRYPKRSLVVVVPSFPIGPDPLHHMPGVNFVRYPLLHFEQTQHHYEKVTPLVNTNCQIDRMYYFRYDLLCAHVVELLAGFHLVTQGKQDDQKTEVGLVHMRATSQFLQNKGLAMDEFNRFRISIRGPLY